MNMLEREDCLEELFIPWSNPPQTQKVPSNGYTWSYPNTVQSGPLDQHKQYNFTLRLRPQPVPLRPKSFLKSCKQNKENTLRCGRSHSRCGRSQGKLYPLRAEPFPLRAESFLFVFFFNVNWVLLITAAGTKSTAAGVLSVHSITQLFWIGTPLNKFSYMID